MKKIVILTGAGAVIPWGAPKTDKITSKLRKDSKFTTTTNVPVGEYLYSLLGNLYHVNTRGINFEHIVDLVEQLYGYYTSVKSGAQPQFKSSISAVFDIRKDVENMFRFSENPFRKLGKRFYLREIYRHFINLIIEEISKYSSSSSIAQYEELNTKFQAFLNCFRKDKIRFYTTNYDRIPFRCSKKHFFDGFPLKSKGQYEFDRVRLVKDDYKNSYINLHGSIYFKPKSIKIIVDGEEREKYYWICTRNKINKINVNMKGSKDQTNRHLIGSNIVAGLYKPARLMITPIFQFYQKFYRDCLDADCILVIGYSHGDKHLNVAIRDAVMIKKPKIFDINYIKSLSKNKNGGNAEWNRYSGKLGKTYRTKFTISLKGNAKWVSDMQGTLKVYLKGFKKFLLNHEWENCV